MGKTKKKQGRNVAINQPPDLEDPPRSPPLSPPLSLPFVPPTKKAYQEVEEPQISSISYSKGPPRRHHQFFMDTGDFFLQVEHAIFRIHRYHLVDHSGVWKERFSSASDDRVGASEECPWVLGQFDKYRAWELFLSLFYRRNPLIAVAHSGEEAIEVLEIAQRHNVEIIKETIVAYLGNAGSTPEFVDLMIASRIVGSESLQEKAMKGLLNSPRIPDLNEAKRLGLDVYYALWNRDGKRKNPSCRGCCSNGTIYCDYCGTFQ